MVWELFGRWVEYNVTATILLIACGIHTTWTVSDRDVRTDDPSLDARQPRLAGGDRRLRAKVRPASANTTSVCTHDACSLQDALYEPALEYYANHSKRVGRKRNRHSQAASYQLPLSPMASTGIARPLRPEGWTVRYEYKMACFAEFRGEDQVALK